jgi:hypothetical protein
MKKTLKLLPMVCALAMLLPLAGCPTPPPPPPPPPPVEIPKAPEKTPEEIQKEQTRAAARDELKNGIDAYNAGDFNGSLKILLDSKTIWVTDNDIQLDALKYSAFDYCVTNRANLCKQQFEKALKLSPEFDLLPGENDHPLWGPVFKKAKKAAAAAAPKQ